MAKNSSATSAMAKPLPNPQHFYVSASLYDVFAFSDSDRDKIFEIIFGMQSIDCHCIKCGASATFRPIANNPYKHEPDFSMYRKYEDRPYNALNHTEWVTLPTALQGYYQKVFVCARDERHEMRFFIMLDHGRLIKIGQFPSVADLTFPEISEYKAVLGDFFTEFKTAIGLYSHGVGVGSFVYLRRIIENLIMKEAYEVCKSKPEWNEEEFQRARFADKVKMIQAELSEFLVDNVRIYSVLSKGIHELSEKECLDYFPILKVAIEMIADDLLEKRKKAEKRRLASEALSKIGQTHK